MKRFTITLMASFALLFSKAQTITFENLNLTAPINSWNGGPGTISKDTFFTSGICTFRNSYTYDTSFGGYSYWSGFGYSNKKDSVDGNYFTNEMACMAAEGANGSSTYGIAYLSWDSHFNKIIFPANSKPTSLMVTNSTYAYKTILNGGGGATPFGGSSGNVPDYFRLDITGWSNGMPKTDTIKFYLADYRDANNSNDYIIKNWTKVNLTQLGMCDSLTYNLVSSDTNSLGSLTPSYFCIDNIEFEPLNIEINNTDKLVNVYPNPFNAELKISNIQQASIQYKLFNMKGQLIKQGNIEAGKMTNINTNAIIPGTYILRLVCDSKIQDIKLIK